MSLGIDCNYLRRKRSATLIIHITNIPYSRDIAVYHCMILSNPNSLISVNYRVNWVLSLEIVIIAKQKVS